MEYEHLGLKISICDTLANILHFCHREGIDFADRLKVAQMHFETEINGTEQVFSEEEEKALRIQEDLRDAERMSR